MENHEKLERDKTISPLWNEVNVEYEKDGQGVAYVKSRTRRIPVPGGWIYCYQFLDLYSHTTSVATSFVPGGNDNG